MAKTDKDGNWIDARGALFPPSCVSDIDKKKDSFVEKKIKTARKLAEQLAEFRRLCAKDMESMLEEYAKSKKVKANWKGNIQFRNFDDSLVVERSMNDVIDFNENLQLAKAQVDTWIKKRIEIIDPSVGKIISQAFNIDKKGRVNTAMLLKLISLEIDDSDWKKAMALLKDGITVKATKTYFRFKEKVETEGVETWRNISLNFSDAGE